jgi:hypothetical protein
MNVYNFYLTSKIASKEIKDKITVKSKYKIKNVKIDECATNDGNNQDIKSNLLIETDQSEKGISEMIMREKYQSLPDYDKERVLKNGIVKKSEVEYDNWDLFYNFNH